MRHSYIQGFIHGFIWYYPKIPAYYITVDHKSLTYISYLEDSQKNVLTIFNA